MKPSKTTTQTLLSCVLYFLCCFSSANTADKPNIVLVFMDNFGWGEPGKQWRCLKWLRTLGDFHLFKLLPAAGVYVQGFGKAYDLEEAELLTSQ